MALYMMPHADADICLRVIMLLLMPVDATPLFATPADADADATLRHAARCATLF